MDVAVWLVALAFAGMGLVGLMRPVLIGRFFDVRFDSVDGRNEVRAVYGGFGLAIAFALGFATQSPAYRGGILLCVALALGGMAIGRLIGAVLERPGRWPWIFFAIEAAGAAVLLVALR